MNEIITKDINKAVDINLDRFPENFYFQISKEEYQKILRFQNGTLEVKCEHLISQPKYYLLKINLELLANQRYPF